MINRSALIQKITTSTSVFTEFHSESVRLSSLIGPEWTTEFWKRFNEIDVQRLQPHKKFKWALLTEMAVTDDQETYGTWVICCQ